MFDNAFLKSFLSKGIQEEYSDEKNSQIVAFNKIAGFGYLLLIPFLFINLFFGQYDLVILNIISIILNSLALLLNRKSLNSEAIFIFFHTGAFILISYHYLLGPEARIEYLCFTYMVCVFTCFGRDKLNSIIYYWILIIGTYFLIYNSSLILPAISYDHSKFYITVMSNSIFLSSIMGCVAAPLIFSFENKKREYKLEQAKKETENILKQKTTFFSMLSHEIRTPLHGIIGLSELLAEKKTLPKNVVEKLNVINFSAKNLKSIIGDILDYSKIEEGKLNISYTKLDIGQLINDTTNSHKLRAEVKNLSFDVSTSNLPSKIKSDELRISQILNILLDNAIKFTYNGYVNTEVHYSPNGSDQGELMIKVSDTGIGIPLKDQQNIFSPYSQVQTSSTRNQEGTGLGLAICKNIVMLLDGDLKLQSIPNKGTEITVTFPVKTAFNENENLQQGNLSNKLNGLKGLLVEDNMINQFVCEEVFKSLGISYDLVPNGAKAIEKCEIKKYDFIIMDYHMPQMDGFVASKKIRENEEKRGKVKTPIIISTADSMGTSPELYSRYQIDGHLVKPFTKKELAEELLKLKSKFNFKTNLMEGVTMLGQINFNGNQIDFQHIQKLFQGDLKSGNQLIALVIDAIPKQLHEINSLKNDEEANKKRLITLVHNLKSNFRNIGAKNFSLALQIGEDSLRNGEDFITLWQAMRLVEQHYHLITEEKDKFINKA